MLNVMMPVQGDPTREWLERRSVDEFVHRWEEQKKNERGESVSDEDEDDDDLPAAKRRKTTPSEGLTLFTVLVLIINFLHCCFRCLSSSEVLVECDRI